MSDLPAIDVDRANAARMYDYFLGGFHNFAADRAAADAAQTAFPGVRETARANRSFLRRAVRFLAEQGVDQFLDLGSGVPTVGNVHEIARAAKPDARVVYVDNEPVAVKSSQMLLADEPNTAIVSADLRDVDAVLGDPVVADMLDLDRPLAVMLVSVLHFMPDHDEAAAVAHRYVEAMPSGSYLVLSHFCDPALVTTRVDDVRRANAVYATTANPSTWRTFDQIASLFDGLTPVAPGIVHVLDWHPERDPGVTEQRELVLMYGGVGRKP